MVSASWDLRNHLLPSLAEVPLQHHDGGTLTRHYAPPVDDGEWMEMPVGTGGVDPLGVLDLLGGAVIVTEATLGSGPTGARHR